MRRWLPILALLGGVGACDSAPGTEGVAGEWRGQYAMGNAQWTVALTVRHALDTITGTALQERAWSGRFDRYQYVLSGRLHGDSVAFRLRPVEDADVHIAGVLHGGRIEGRLWFNDLEESAVPVTLRRPAAAIRIGPVAPP